MCLYSDKMFGFPKICMLQNVILWTISPNHLKKKKKDHSQFVSCIEQPTGETAYSHVW